MAKSGSAKSAVADLQAEVARKVVTESLRLRKGESVAVETWNNGLPLALKFAAEAKGVGAIPLMIFEDEETYVNGVKNAPKDAIGRMGKHEYGLLANSDAYFFIPNELLEGYAKRLTPDEAEEATEYGDSWYDAAGKAKLRGARMSFGFAGKELASMLGKRLEDIQVHQLKATLVDFGAVRKAGKEIEARIDPGSGGSIASGGSQLRFEYERGSHIEDGVVDKGDIASKHVMAYLPPGFLRKAVRPDSVSGKVKLSPSVAWAGIIRDATLEFERGRLVRWTSRNSKKELDEVIEDKPEDTRRVESVTIGLNQLLRYGYGQDRFVAGSIGIEGLGFNGTLRSGTLRAGHSVLVNRGKIVLP